MWNRRKQICPQGLCIPGENNKPVPLKDVKVDATIQGFVCQVTSTLTYENVEDGAVEALFVFPMDDGCAVYQFEAEIDDRRIVAECQDSEEAQQTYKDAVDQGYTSILLSQDRNSADIFECNVGNLPAKKTAIVKFSYVKELPLTIEGGVKFLLPSLLNPRYNPAPQDGGASDSKLQNSDSVPPNAVPYTFSFEAAVSSTREVLNVTSKHDDVHAKISDDKTSASVSLKKVFTPDHDLSFELFYDKIYEPCAILAGGNKERAGLLQKDVLMLNFFPELDESACQGQKEFIFIIDRSGSMQGPRITSAKESLLLFLKSLPADCYFNIVSFGSRHQSLFPNGSEKYSEDSLRRACELQSYMEADFGGTEILRPLQDIYQRPAIDGYPRQIFVLTDGAVGNVNSVIALVKKNAANARVFTFGIGEGASTSLVKGLARAGQGKAMFVTDADRLQPKVMKILKSAMQLGASDIKVDVEGVSKKNIVPHPVPPLYSGDRLVVYAMFDESERKFGDESKAILSGKLGNKDIKFHVPLSTAKLSVASDAMPIHRLAAKAQIAQLEGEEDEENIGQAGSSKSMIVLLSTSANIVSKYTSMVGVDTVCEGSKKVEKRRIPTPAYSGGMGHLFGGRGGRSMLKGAPVIMACAAPMPMAIAHSAEPPLMPAMMMAKRAHAAPMPKACPPPPPGAQWSNQMKKRTRSPRTSAASVEMSDCMDEVTLAVGYMAIVQLQAFKGNWALNQELAAVLKKSLYDLKKASPQVDENIWATALALSTLRKEYQSEHEEWEMVEMKAIQWLTSNGANVKEILGQAINAIN